MRSEKSSLPGDGELPAYSSDNNQHLSPTQSQSQSQSQPQSSAHTPSPADDIPSEAYPASDNLDQVGKGVPTVDAPFNFPTDDRPPAYEPVTATASSSSSAGQLLKPIAIPQTVPDATAPFLTAYPPSLLSRGVTEDSWKSFMDTISAFLTAKVGDRAISHAGDMAKHFSEDTRSLGKGVVSQTKHLGRDLSRHAKKGNLIGVATTAISGVIAIPIYFALGAADTAVKLPGAAVGAIVKKPRTPVERVNAYAAVANEKWLHGRGLHAQLVDTHGLAQVLGLPASQFLAVARGGKEGSAVGMLKALEMHIEPLKLAQDETLGLSEKSLWLVVAQEVREES